MTDDRKQTMFAVIVAVISAQLVEIVKKAAELNPRSPKR
jgi:hypothetical protein